MGWALHHNDGNQVRAVKLGLDSEGDVCVCACVGEVGVLCRGYIREMKRGGPLVASEM